MCGKPCTAAYSDPFLLAAMALIPDDDDEELIEKAKANRKTRLQTEKVAEKEYAKTGGFADSEVVAVQVSSSPAEHFSGQAATPKAASHHEQYCGSIIVIAACHDSLDPHAA